MAARSERRERDSGASAREPLRHRCARWMRGARTDCVNFARLVARYPSTLGYPLAVLALIVGVGVWGITRVARADADSKKAQASAIAVDVATSFRQQLTVAYGPIHAMAALVQQNPQYAAVSAVFNSSFVPELASQTPPGSIRSLQLAPLGVIRLVYPLAGNAAAVGLDLFAVAAEKDGAVKTVTDRVLTLVGPMTFRQGGYGVRVRLPIFVAGVEAGADWGGPDRQNPYCGPPCYDPATRSKFWGFATALIDLDAIKASNDSQLAALTAKGYVYELTAPAVAADLSLIARSPGRQAALRDPVAAPIPLPNAEWVLRISPEGGSWLPDWYAPMVAAVVVLAVVISVLQLAVLVSRRQHQQLLEALLPREILRDLTALDASSIGAAIIQTDTPADVLLQMMAVLLEGGTPDLRDVIFLRTTVLRNLDIYAPLNLRSQIKEANLDADVTRALMQQLGGGVADDDSLYNGLPADAAALAAERRAAGGGDPDADGDGDGDDLHIGALGRNGGAAADCSTLGGALALMLTPQPAAWYDAGAGYDMNDAASDAALPAVGAGDFGLTPQHSVMSGSLTLAMPPPLSSPRLPSLAGGAPGGAGGLPSSPLAAGSISVGGGAGGAGRQASGNGMLSGGGPSYTLPLRPLTVSGAPLGTAAAAAATAASGGGSASGGGADILSINCDSAMDMGGGGGGGGHTNGHHYASPPSAPPGGSSIHGGGGGSGGAYPGGAGSVHGGSRLSTRPALLVRRGSKRGSVQLAPAGSGSVSLAPPPSAAAFLCGGGGGMSAGQLNMTLPEDVSQHGSVNRASTGGRVGVGFLAGLGGGGGGGGSTYGGCSGGEGNMLRALTTRRLASMPPPPAVILEVERLLSSADGWQFNTWELQEATHGHALSCMGFYLLHRAGLISRFGLDASLLARLLRHIEAGYNDCPYHNSAHAADVLQTLHVIIRGAQLHAHYLDSLGLLACYLAAIVHDYGHPGVTNDFLIATHDPLAIRYNDRSPLENHHCAAAFSVLARPELDVLAPLSAPERASLRKMVIELVLATDMKQHFSILSHFNTVHRLTSFSSLPGAAQAPQMATTRSRRHLQPGGGGGGGADGATVCPEPSELAPKPKDDTERLLGLQVAMKCADLGHLGEELEVHKRWLAGLEEEFFRQGDRERELGLPISPLFDRNKQGVSKSQVGFYDFVALPLVHAFSNAFPGAGPLMRAFAHNYQHWKGTAATATPPAAGASPPPSVRGGKGTAPAAPPPPSAAGAAAAAELPQEKGGQ